MSFKNMNKIRTLCNQCHSHNIERLNMIIFCTMRSYVGSSCLDIFGCLPLHAISQDREELGRSAIIVMLKSQRVKLKLPTTSTGHQRGLFCY